VDFGAPAGHDTLAHETASAIEALVVRIFMLPCVIDARHELFAGEDFIFRTILGQ
jgi:hypothetical protein